MRIAIFASGKGTNFEAIVKYFQVTNNPLIQIQCLVCDQPGAPVIQIAKKYGIETYEVVCTQYKTKLEESIETKIAQDLTAKKIDLIVLAGYMRIVKKPLLDAFKNRIVNIHPSLLPSFRGLDAVKQALDYGVKVTGCTIHYIDEEIDRGKILAQKAVVIEEDETETSLLEKIHRLEHTLYPEVIEKLTLEFSKGK